MAENTTNEGETPNADAERVMTSEELDAGLMALKTRALGLLEKLDAQKAAAEEEETERIAAAIEESKKEELVPLDVPLNSREAALNLGRMVARNERLFDKLLKHAAETSYQETFHQLVLMAARTAQVTGSLVAVMHRIDGEVRHHVRREQTVPVVTEGNSNDRDS